MYRSALERARQQGNYLFAGRAAIGLARLLTTRGEVGAARDLPAATLAAGSFTDTTRDLTEARDRLLALEGVQA